MGNETHAKVIATYKEGPAVVAGALEGITEEEITFRPAPGEWTVREILQHLADAELIMNGRLRYMLAEENPPLIGFDQNTWVDRLNSPTRPIANNLALFTAIHAATGDILDEMSDADWARTGAHTELGEQTIEGMLTYIAGHGHDHAKQIRNNRAAANAALSAATRTN